MKKPYPVNKLFYSLALTLLSFTNFACAGDNTVMVPVDKSAKLVIAVDESGEVVTLKGINNKGRAEDVGKCALCSAKLSKEFGDHCEELIKNDDKRKKVFEKMYGKENAGLPVCGATTRATINSTANIDLLVTHKNPHCIVKVKSGDEIVYVYPADCLIK